MELTTDLAEGKRKSSGRTCGESLFSAPRWTLLGLLTPASAATGANHCINGHGVKWDSLQTPTSEARLGGWSEDSAR